MPSGGKRPGAGAKTLGDQKRVTLAVRVDAMTKEKLKAASQNAGTSVGQIIDKIVKVTLR